MVSIWIAHLKVLFPSSHATPADIIVKILNVKDMGLSWEIDIYLLVAMIALLSGLSSFEKYLLQAPTKVDLA